MIVFDNLNPIKKPDNHIAAGSRLITVADIKKTGAIPCGSRFFAKRFPDCVTIKADTDYDYFVQYDERVYNELRKDGFKCVHRDDVCMPQVIDDESAKYPFDDDCIAILSGSNCQLIMRNDAIMYSDVIHSITGEFYRDYIWKSGENKPNKKQIRSIFNALFKSYYAGKGVEAPVLASASELEIIFS